jgi:hypothetical protein
MLGERAMLGRATAGDASKERRNTPCVERVSLIIADED